MVIASLDPLDENIDHFEFGRRLTAEEIKKEMKRFRHVPFWMKLFLGCNKKDRENHQYGFLSGLSYEHGGDSMLAISNFSVKVDIAMFFLNMLIFTSFYFVHPKKSNSKRYKLAFDILAGAFFSINALGAVYNYIDVRFIYKFQNCNFGPVMSNFLWLLFWIYNAGFYFFRDHPFFKAYLHQA